MSAKVDTDKNNAKNDISFEKNEKKQIPEEKDALKGKKDTKELYAEYKNFKWKEPEKLKNGPIGDESRKCRDCICCIIFLIFIIGCIIIALLGFLLGDPQKILYSYDEDGNACGLNETYKNYTMLYFYDVIGNLEQFKISKIVNAFCVNECPNEKLNKTEYENKNKTLDCLPTKNNPNCEITYKNYYRSKKLLNRFCFPDNSDEEEFNDTTQKKIEVYDYSRKKNIERIVNKDDISSDGAFVKIEALSNNNSKVASEQLINFSFFEDKLIQWISDIYVARYVILASVVWSFLLAMVFLLFLRLCAGIIIFLILIGIFVGLVILAIILRFNMNYYKDQDDETKTIVFCVFFWVSVVLSVIWLLLVIIMCNRIRLSIALIEITAKYINRNCSILWIPFFFFIITILWIEYWVSLSVYL